MSLKDVIKDPKFISVLKSLPAETELSPVIKGYLETEHAELVDQVTFPEEGSAPVEPAPAPVEPAPAAAAAPAAPEQGAAMPVEQPVAAESSDDAPFDGGRPVGDKKDKFGNTVKKRAQHSAKQGLAAAIEKARKAGMKSEDIVEIGGQKMSLSELAERAGIELKPHPKEIVEFIKSFYDREHGTFPKGETGVLIATEKKFGESAASIAHRVIETLSQISETHRMRKMAGLGPDNMAFESLTYKTFMLSEADPPKATNATTLRTAQDFAAGNPAAAPKKKVLAPVNPQVMARQNELIAAGAKIKADGRSGPATDKAEKEFGPKVDASKVTNNVSSSYTGNPAQATDRFAGQANTDAQTGQNNLGVATPATPGTGAPGSAFNQGAAAIPGTPAPADDLARMTQLAGAGRPAGGFGNFTGGQAAQPELNVVSRNDGVPPPVPVAEPAAAAPSTVAPVVKTSSGGALTTRDGKAVTSRSDDEIAWAQKNPYQPYPGPGWQERQKIQGQKNLDALKGVGDKISNFFSGNKAPAPAATPGTAAAGSAFNQGVAAAPQQATMENEELSRLINLIHYR
jgi:sulfur relay (sulfurtransferase) DsrC/TusE family protein